MNMLNIRDTIRTQYAVAKEDGEAIYELILPVVKKGNAILLNFAGIERATSLFFNESLCKIIGELGIKEYQKLINVEEMSDTIKVIYLRAMNLTLRKIEDPSIYNDALKEGIKANVES